VEWIPLPYDGVQWRAAMVTAMNYRVLQNAQNILTLLHEDSIAVQSMKMSTAGCIGIYNM